jgi:hypothetical protein
LRRQPRLITLLEVWPNLCPGTILVVGRSALRQV